MRRKASESRSQQPPLTWQELIEGLARHILNLNRIASRSRSCRPEVRRWARELDLLVNPSSRSAHRREVQRDR
jgi:hypothetical protein